MESNELKSFKNRLLWLIGDSNPTAFGKKCAVSQKSIERYAKGEQEPNLKNILKIARACGINVGWLAAGEGPKNILENGQVRATISPGEEAARAKLLQQQNSPIRKNVHLRQLVEWMDKHFTEEKAEQALFFYEDIKDRYKSFEEFMEKKRPSENTAPGPAQTTHRKAG